MKPTEFTTFLLCGLALTVSLNSAGASDAADGQSSHPDAICVANINRGTVKGPFYTFSDAIKQLNSNKGGPKNRQMICLLDRYEAGTLGKVADPTTYAPGDSNYLQLSSQQGDASNGMQSWWYGWKDIKLMAHMCESECSETDVYNKGRWRCRGKVEYAANYKGEVLANVRAASAAECCAACGFHKTCNTWNFCSRVQGCGDGKYKTGHCDLKIQRQPNWRSDPQVWFRKKPEAGWVSGVIGEEDPVNEDVDGGRSSLSPEQSWYCVPRLDGSDILGGPFWDLKVAKGFRELIWGNTNGPRMICEMTPCGPRGDPRDVADQTGEYGRTWWRNWTDVLEMNKICENKCSRPGKHPPLTLRPPWYCVSSTSGSNVWGPYSTMSPAKHILGDAKAGSRNVCEMNQELEGVKVDPNPRTDVGLPRSANSFRKYWSDLKWMSRKCRWNQACAGGPPEETPQPTSPPGNYDPSVYYHPPDDYDRWFQTKYGQ